MLSHHLSVDIYLQVFYICKYIDDMWCDHMSDVTHYISIKLTHYIDTSMFSMVDAPVGAWVTVSKRARVVEGNSATTHVRDSMLLLR